MNKVLSATPYQIICLAYAELATHIEMFNQERENVEPYVILNRTTNVISRADLT